MQLLILHCRAASRMACAMASAHCRHFANRCLSYKRQRKRASGPVATCRRRPVFPESGCLEKLLNCEIDELGSIPVSPVSRAGNDEELSFAKSSIKLRCLLDRRKVGVTGNYEDARLDRREIVGIQHGRRQPQAIRLSENGAPMVGPVWGCSLVLATKARRQSLLELGKKLGQLLIGPPLPRLKLVARQAWPQTRARDRSFSSPVTCCPSFTKAPPSPVASPPLPHYEDWTERLSDGTEQ